MLPKANNPLSPKTTREANFLFGARWLPGPSARFYTAITLPYRLGVLFNAAASTEV